MTAAPATEIPAQYLLSNQAPEPRTLVDILYDTAARHPDAPAIDDGSVQLTYSELIEDIEASVGWLGGRGIGRGDRIGVRMPSGSYALYVAILSILAAGAAYVPVDADDPQERADLVLHLRRTFERGDEDGWFLERELGAALRVWMDEVQAARKRSGIMPAATDIPPERYMAAIVASAERPRAETSAKQRALAKQIARKLNQGQG